MSKKIILKRKKKILAYLLLKKRTQNCVQLKKKMSLTRAKTLIIKRMNKSLKELLYHHNLSIDKKSKIKYLD